MRFVPPLAGLNTGAVAFDGDPRARERPMGTLISALRDPGVVVTDDDRAALPFTVVGTGSIPGGTVELDASGSSQFVSALLLSGARYDHGVTIAHRGGPVPSLPHIDMTRRMLRTGVACHRGRRPDRTDARWEVGPRTDPPRHPRRGTRPVQCGTLRGGGAHHRRPGGAHATGRATASNRPITCSRFSTHWAPRLHGSTPDCRSVEPGRIRGIDADLRDIGRTGSHHRRGLRGR